MECTQMWCAERGEGRIKNKENVTRINLRSRPIDRRRSADLEHRLMWLSRSKGNGRKEEGGRKCRYKIVTDHFGSFGRLTFL